MRFALHRTEREREREYTHTSHLIQSFDTIVIIFMQMQIYHKIIKIHTRLLRETYYRNN